MMSEKFDRLKTYRIDVLGITREELANRSGISAATIRALEEGRTNYHNAQISTLIALCCALDCKLINLFPEYKKWIV